MKRNLIGVKFGEWTVLSYSGKGMWACRCSCGNTKSILTGKLVCGQTLSCGHNKLISLKGNSYGEWEVLEYKGNSMWACRCSCGATKNISSRHLRNGVSTSCGHTGNTKIIDLAGQTFGEYTVTRYLGDKMWLCECSCGKIKSLSGSRIRHGETTSCGHLGRLKDITGEVFDQLTVVKYIGNTKYLCNCACGKTAEVSGNNLRNGSTASCGCKRASIFTREYILKEISRYTKENKQPPFKIDLAHQFGISYGYMLYLSNELKLGDEFSKIFSSLQEKEIYDEIIGMDSTLEVIVHCRSILNLGKELDIYIPSKRLAVEFNGAYWHREDLVGSKYQQYKTIECAKRGIQLIHIFDYEWRDEGIRKKIVSILKSKINNTDSRRVYARNCRVEAIDNSIERKFIDENHLSGYTNSGVAYGLYLGLELISVMTFGKPRFNANYEWELVRYCNKHGTSIAGGASKIFKHFIKKYNPASIISYCDISKFKGKIYSELGFKAGLSDITQPNYKWVKSNAKYVGDVLSRYQTQKNKLLEQGYGVYGSTEDEIMRTLGYFKVYDSGNLRFVRQAKNSSE